MAGRVERWEGSTRGGAGPEAVALSIGSTGGVLNPLLWTPRDIRVPHRTGAPRPTTPWPRLALRPAVVADLAAAATEGEALLRRTLRPPLMLQNDTLLVLVAAGVHERVTSPTDAVADAA